MCAVCGKVGGLRNFFKKMVDKLCDVSASEPDPESLDPMRDARMRKRSIAERVKRIRRDLRSILNTSTSTGFYHLILAHHDHIPMVALVLHMCMHIISYSDHQSSRRAAAASGRWSRGAIRAALKAAVAGDSCRLHVDRRLPTCQTSSLGS